MKSQKEANLRGGGFGDQTQVAQSLVEVIGRRRHRRCCGHPWLKHRLFAKGCELREDIGSNANATFAFQSKPL
jgi:hypothetical protein